MSTTKTPQEIAPQEKLIRNIIDAHRDGDSEIERLSVALLKDVHGIDVIILDGIETPEAPHPEGLGLEIVRIGTQIQKGIVAADKGRAALLELLGIDCEVSIVR